MAAAAGGDRGLVVVPAVTVAGDAVVVVGGAVVVEVVVYFVRVLDSSSGSDADLVHSVHFGILCYQDHFSDPDILLGLGCPLRSGSQTGPALALGCGEGRVRHALVLDLAGC